MSKSESYGPVSKEFELSFAARQGVKLANTLVIQEDADTFTTIVKALMLDIKETYPKSGDKTKLKRRDLKKGKFDGRFMRNQRGDPMIEAAWGDPVAGMSTDTFKVSEDGRSLRLTSVFKRESTQRELSYTIVYNKKE